MAEITIEIKSNFFEEKTNCSKCSICGEPIYGKMFVLYVYPETKKLTYLSSKTDIKLCESCVKMSNVEFYKKKRVMDKGISAVDGLISMLKDWKIENDIKLI